jgi:hypothetical protein
MPSVAQFPSTGAVGALSADTSAADEAVPIGVTVSYSWTDGFYFSTGIVWGNSTTRATKTIGAADSFASVLYL